ncbi:hypothetical protein [Salinicola peritrichatus]|uniref:hypothetical protein n=1 Tax=Salinicola peritrichatus TaxID=1267424 RepID=UPI000DA23255|nr:hypothetical protein [Salinicola peritrichatus]
MLHSEPASAQYHHEDAVLEGQLEGIKDTKPFHFDSFPALASILDNSMIDFNQVSADHANWKFLKTNTILHGFLSKDGADIHRLNDTQWYRVIDLTCSMPQRLCAQTSGNHLFFVGERGARDAARAIAELGHKVRAFKQELIWHFSLLCTP